MAADSFNTVFDLKPAKVRINGSHVEVQLGSDGGTSWTFDKALTPHEYRVTSGSIPAEFRREAESGLLTRCKSEIHGWQPVTAQTDKQLATFSEALAVIESVSSTPGFPADIKAKLPDAHKALGFEYNTGQLRA